MHLTGVETITIGGIQSGQDATVSVARQDGSQTTFATIVRIDAPVDVEYFRQRGILQMAQ